MHPSAKMAMVFYGGIFMNNKITEMITLFGYGKKLIFLKDRKIKTLQKSEFRKDVDLLNNETIDRNIWWVAHEQ